MIFHALLLKGLGWEKKNSPNCPLLRNSPLSRSRTRVEDFQALRGLESLVGERVQFDARPGRLVLFEMNPSTELLAYAALALVAYAVALLLLWLWL